MKASLETNRSEGGVDKNDLLTSFAFEYIAYTDSLLAKFKNLVCFFDLIQRFILQTHKKIYLFVGFRTKTYHYYGNS